MISRNKSLDSPIESDVQRSESLWSLYRERRSALLSGPLSSSTSEGKVNRRADVCWAVMS